VSRRDAWVIIPAKSFACAKQRLSPLLTGGERAVLARTMLADVFRAAAGVSGLDNIAVVTGADDVAREAERLGAMVIDDREAIGTNQAIEAGLAAVRSRGGRCIVTLPGDVPAVMSEDIAALLGIVERGCVAIVPAPRDGGTNALAFDRPERIEPCFGPQSFVRHVASANRAGIKPAVVLNTRLGLDLDQPGDLFRFLDLRTSTATDRYLHAIALPQRRAGFFDAETLMPGAAMREPGAGPLQLRM
jgi:2-phospho-L-lactate guanylyltransferase